MLAVTVAVFDGLVLAGLQAIERATGGWNLGVFFFRVPYILDGPWYLTWLTSFVGLTLLFVYGMWWGLLYLGWGRNGLRVFITAQIAVLLAVGLIADRIGGWPGIGQFFTALTGAGLTGVLAIVAAGLLVGGFAMTRHATV
jgi:hypothetical protein